MIAIPSESTREQAVIRRIKMEMETIVAKACGRRIRIASGDLGFTMET